MPPMATEPRTREEGGNKKDQSDRGREEGSYVDIARLMMSEGCRNLDGEWATGRVALVYQ
jgi:hypothetical protein